MPVLSSVWVPVLVSEVRSIISIAPAMPYHCPPVLPCTVPSTAQVSSVLSQYHPPVLGPLSSVVGQARSRLSCPGRLRPPLRPAASPGWPATGGLVAVLRPRLAVSVQDNNNNSVTMHHVSCCLHPAPGTYPNDLVTWPLLGTLVLVLALARPGKTPHFPRQARYGTLTTWWWRK